MSRAEVFGEFDDQTGKLLGLFNRDPAGSRGAVPEDGKGLASAAQGAQTLGGVGDSFAFGVGASTPEQAWLPRLATHLGLTLTNSAISGTVLQNSADAGGSARASNGRDTYAGFLTGAAKKDVAVVAHGFNDARYVAAPGTFNVAAYETDADQVISGLILAGYPRSKILFVTPHYITAEGLATGSAGFFGQSRAGFEAFVSAAARVAYDNGVQFADSYSAMRDNGGATLISADKIHANDNGHAVIFAAAAAAVPLNGIPAPAAPVARKTAASTLGVSFLPSLVGGALSYQIEIASAATLAWGSRYSGSTAGASFAALADGTYYVRCRTVIGSEWSPWSYSEAVAINAVAPATTFAEDNFDGAAEGTDMTSRAQSFGGAWSVYPGYTTVSPKLTAAGTMYSIDGNTAWRMAVEPSANLYVEGVFDCKTAVSADNIGLFVHGAPIANTMYLARLRLNNTWELVRLVSGTATILGTHTSTIVAGTTRLLRLEIVGSDLVVKLDGATVITATDTTLTAAGYVGFRWAATQTATTGTHLSSISAGTL